MSNKECVLVVDEIPDTAEVLQAVLGSRGLTVNRVRYLDQTVMAGATAPPAVVVVDAESLEAGRAPAAPGWPDVPHVIIGTVNLAGISNTEPADGASNRRYLQKPFQFAELVRAIETLVAGRR